MIVFPRTTTDRTTTDRTTTDRTRSEHTTTNQKRREQTGTVPFPYPHFSCATAAQQVWCSLRLGRLRTPSLRTTSLRSTGIGILLVLAVSTSAFAQSCPLYPSPHQRIGFNVAPDGGIDIDDYDAAQLGAGWYHNYSRRHNPHHPGGIQFHQMVRSGIDRTQLPQLLGPVIANNPGALWILGNEPDHYGQDGLKPAEYAQFYHDLYTYLKAADPSARIAIAGIVQPTPIRLRYLDMVLSSYQQLYNTRMPVEIWDIHNFILPEDCGWGASLPPGLEAYRDEAVDCPPTLDDHGNIDIFKAQIRTFRQWMKDRGYRDTPLIVTEYGILLSKYHEYDYARVRDFMRASFDFMLNTTDAQLGYPADGNRLVQEFAWFSLNYWEFDIKTYFGLNGNLFDHDSAQIMPLGRDFAAYTQAVTIRTIDLNVTGFQALTTTPAAHAPVTLRTSFVNQGGVAADQVTVQYWNGNPNAGGTLLGSAPLHPQVLTGCHETHQSEFTWTPGYGGLFTLYTVLSAANSALELEPINNSASLALFVQGATPTPTVTPTRTPQPLPTATATATGGTPTPLITVPPLTQTPVTPTPSVTPQPGTPTPTPTTPVQTETHFVADPARTTSFAYTNPDGTQISLVFPAGTVELPTAFVFRPLAAPGADARSLAFAGRAFQLEAYRDGVLLDTFLLEKPILVTISYLDSDISQLDEHELMLYVLDSSTNEWQRQGTTLISHSPATNQLTVSYSDGSRAPAAKRSFALYGVPASAVTPTATPTPTTVITPTPTPTMPSVTDYEERIYLPLINGGS